MVDTGGSAVGGGCGGGGGGGFEGVQQAGAQILLEEKLYLWRGLVECGGVEVMAGVEVEVEGAAGARKGAARHLAIGREESFEHQREARLVEGR